MKNHKLLARIALAIVASIGAVLGFAFMFNTALAQSSALEASAPSTPEPTPVPPEFLPSSEPSSAQSSHSCVGIHCVFHVEESTDDAGPVSPPLGVGACTYSTGFNEVYIGECPDGQPITSGFRFRDVTIPKGMKISQAYLEFTVDGPYRNNVLVDIFGEATSNPVPFGPSPNRPEDRSFTSATVPWAVTVDDRWELGHTRRSPDIAPIVREIVNQDSWQEGNPLAIILRSIALGNLSDTDPGKRHRRVVGIDRPTTTYIGDVPRLVVILRCEDVAVVPPLSLTGQAAAAQLGTQYYCENQYQGLSFTPGLPLGENTGFHDWAALAEDAEVEVLFSNMEYEPHDDELGDSPGDILAKAVASLYQRITANPGLYPQGLTVRILIGNQVLLADQRTRVLADLRRAGVLEMENDEIGWKLEVARYRNGPRTLAWSHAKFMVVDGSTVLAAGFNMTYDHREDLVDFGVRATGPIAHDALLAFDELWRDADGKRCNLSVFFWRFTCDDVDVDVGHAPDVEAIRVTGGDLNSFSLFRTDDPANKEADRTVQTVLTSANTSIEVLNPWFTLHSLIAVPDVFGYDFEANAPAYMRGLRDAIARNAAAGNTAFKVRVLLAPDKPYFATLNEIGIKAFLAELGPLDQFVEFRSFPGRAHAKVSVVDGQFIIVGSQNWSFSAFGDDNTDTDLAEYSLGLDSAVAAQDFLGNYFDGGFQFWNLAGKRTIVRDGDDLKAAIEGASDGDVIVVYGDRFEISDTVNVTSEIQIIGLGAVVSPTGSSASTGGHLAALAQPSQSPLMRILASNVEVIGLRLRGADGFGMVIGEEEEDFENIRISYVVFEDNSEGGVLVQGESVEYTIDNNTFVGGPFGIALSVEDQLDQARIRSNIFASQLEAPILAFPGDGGNTDYSYNLFFECGVNPCIDGFLDGNLGANSTVHDNLFDIDPLFVDFDEGDYRLTAGSPAIDGGDPTIRDAYIPDGDGDGDARIDIGAFESLPFANAAPSADAGGPYSSDEGDPLTFDSSGSSDPDGDPLEFRWDFDGDGVFDTEFAAGPAATFTFGDDFSGQATVEVRDSGGLTNSDIASVEVFNVEPNLELERTDAISFAGGDAFLGRLSVEQMHQATGTDSGSDDLTFGWSLGPTTTYFNDGFGPDPFPSIGGVFLFSVTDVANVTLNSPGTHDVLVEVGDDDGGMATASLPKIVTGDAVCPASLDFWEEQFGDDEEERSYDQASLHAFLEIVDFASAFFSEQVPLGTIENAHSIFEVEDGPIDEAVSEVLAAWLNFAHGSMGWDELIDTDDDDTADTPFHGVVAQAETILLDTGATEDRIERAQELAEAINEHNEDSQLCDDTGEDDDDGEDE